MSFQGDNNGASAAAEVVTGTRLLPRITVQAFCERTATAELVEATAFDRRMSKVALTTHNGGIEGAIESYKSNPTPNLIIVETGLDGDALLTALQHLAEVCDASTRLIVLGHINDVQLYRELIRSGVSEYVVLPAESTTLVGAIADIFVAPDSAPIGRSVAFVGAKGGAGASTVAHNVAWAISQYLRQEVLILDLDLAFGTVGLNFNQDPPHGVADALNASAKVDPTLLDRLTSKAANHLSLLTAPAMLDKTYDFEERAFEQLNELAQGTTPVIVLDLPHIWAAWTRHTLATADQIVIVAEPDLANLRNAKNLADAIKSFRPNEAPPLLLVNKVGVPRRPEIAAAEFAASVGCQLLGTLPFDAESFGVAANNGQMLAEISSNGRISEMFKTVAMQVTGRALPSAAAKATGLNFAGLLKRLKAS